MPIKYNNFDCHTVLDNLESIIDRYQNEKQIPVYQKLTYNKGETVLKQGIFLSNQIFLKKGTIKVILEGNNKKNHIIRIVLENDFIGLSALFHDEVSPFSAISMEECEIILIKLDPFKKIITENSELNSCIIALRSQYFKLLYDKLSIQSTRNSYGKIAHALLYIDEIRFKQERIYQIITRRDLADIAGVSHESVMKILNELKADKIINIKDKEIEIVDKSLLERLGNIG